MKIKALYIMIAILMLVPMVSATTVTMQPLNAFQSWLLDQNSNTKELYVTGGTLDVPEVVSRGDVFSGYLNLKYTQDATEATSQGYRTRVDLYFVINQVGDTTPWFIKEGTYYSSTAHEVGDWVKVNFKEIDTSVMNNPFCNQDVVVAGKHYVWQNGQWVEDKISVTSLLAYRTSTSFRLSCEENPNPCERKLLGYVCQDGDRWEKWQEDFKDGDDCAITYDRNTCGPARTCEDGTCIDNEICAEGEQDCSSYSGTVFAIECLNNKWEAYDVCSETNACFEGKCTDKQDPSVDECQGNSDCPISEECSSGSCVAKTDCVSCTEDKICSSGDTLLVCRDGCYSATDIKICPEVCTDGDQQQKQCPDGSFIVTAQCYDGEWQYTTAACDTGYCFQDDDCTANEYCDANHQCVANVKPECTSDADCSISEECSSGLCVAKGVVPTPQPKFPTEYLIIGVIVLAFGGYYYYWRKKK